MALLDGESMELADGGFSGEPDPTKVFTSLTRIEPYQWLA